jgi:hypothetical protein
MSNPIVYISEDEHVELIRRSSHEHHVPTSFGGGRVWITPGTADTHWALLQIADIRGIDLSATGLKEG